MGLGTGPLRLTKVHDSRRPTRTLRSDPTVIEPRTLSSRPRMTRLTESGPTENAVAATGDDLPSPAQQPLEAQRVGAENFSELLPEEQHRQLFDDEKGRAQGGVLARLQDSRFSRGHSKHAWRPLGV